MDLPKQAVDEELSTKFKHSVENALHYAMTADLKQTSTAKGTVFGAYDAVTGFYQNVYGFKDEASKLQSILMGGTAQTRAQRAFQLCGQFAKESRKELVIN